MSTQLLPLKKPHPNFRTFEEVVIKGEKEPGAVPFVELLVDLEVIEFISKTMIGTEIPSFWNIVERKINKFIARKKIVLLEDHREEFFWKHYINFYYRMGYDYVPDIAILLIHASIVAAASPQHKQTIDTASLSRGKRTWAEEGKGVITCWEDFENFSWEAFNLEVEEYYHFLDKSLPGGMKMIVAANLYEQVMEHLLGYGGLFYLLYDEPELVKAIFDKLGNIVYEYYKKVIPLDCVGAIFHPDDLAFKTSTMLSPDVLRELVFPWLKKYASLAHHYRKTFWYHCCGYKDEIIEDLITDVKIDALHSFEDACCPVIEFKRRYGNRITILGGVDVDKLCRLDEQNLRKYVRNILNECMPGGRYALGSGNSIANYVPVENYLIMLDEGLKWRTNQRSL